MPHAERFTPKSSLRKCLCSFSRAHDCSRQSPELKLQITLKKIEVENLLFVYYEHLLSSIQAKLNGRSIFSRGERVPDFDKIMPPTIERLGEYLLASGKRFGETVIAGAWPGFARWRRRGGSQDRGDRWRREAIGMLGSASTANDESARVPENCRVRWEA